MKIAVLSTTDGKTYIGRKRRTKKGVVLTDPALLDIDTLDMQRLPLDTVLIPYDKIVLYGDPKRSIVNNYYNLFAKVKKTVRKENNIIYLPLAVHS